MRGAEQSRGCLHAARKPQDNEQILNLSACEGDETSVGVHA